jgi:uncharacterized protein (TIGR02996 family)
MSVFFVYRCPYCGPAGLHVKRFEEESILDWLRRHWDHLMEDPKEAGARAEEMLGCRVYSFPVSFQEAAQEGLPAPATTHEMEAFLSRGYIPEEPYLSPHLVQVCTDDDERGLAYYLFDGHYLKEHAALAAFLTREDWKLPPGRGPGGFVSTEPTVLLQAKGKEEGTTYLVDLDSVGDMDDLCDAHRLEGVRLPDLARFLLRTDGAGEPDPCSQLVTLRALVGVEGKDSDPLEVAFLHDIRIHPEDAAAWNAYSDWLQERGGCPAGMHLLQRALARAGVWDDEDMQLPEGVSLDPWDLVDLPGEHPRLRALADTLDALLPQSRSLVHVEDHVAQLALHHHTWVLPKREKHIYHHWILFDDLWAGAHPDLANAILRFVRRWDVLTPPDAGEGMKDNPSLAWRAGSVSDRRKRVAVVQAQNHPATEATVAEDRSISVAEGGAALTRVTEPGAAAEHAIVYFVI